jgi:hypothetical protein
MLEIDEEINIDDIISLLKERYPDKKIEPSFITKKSSLKKFKGIDDLLTICDEDFAMPSRVSLYDR